MIRGYNKKSVVFMICLLWVTLCFMTVLFLPPALAAEPVGKFSRAEGTVDVLRGGVLPALPVKAGDPVFVKDVIRTKSGSKAEVLFIDGNTIKISQRSRVDVNEYFVQENKSLEILQVPRGKVEAIVPEKNARRISTSPAAHKFEIHTPCAVTGVRSTRYAVVQGDNCAAVLATEGTVYIFNPKFPDKVVEVHAGQITKVCEDGPPLPPRNATEEEKKEFEMFGTVGESTLSIMGVIITTPPGPGIDVQPPVTDIYPGLIEPPRRRTPPPGPPPTEGKY